MQRELHKFVISGRVQEAFGRDGYSSFLAKNERGDIIRCSGQYINAKNLKGEFYLVGKYSGNARFTYKHIAGVDVRTREQAIGYAEQVFGLEEDLSAKWLMSGTTAFVRLEVDRGLPAHIMLISTQEREELEKAIYSGLKKHDFLTHLSESGFSIAQLLRADKGHDDFMMSVKRNPYMLYHLSVSSFYVVDNYIKKHHKNIKENDPRRIVAKACEAIEKRVIDNGHTYALFSTIKNVLSKDEKWTQSEIYSALEDQSFYPMRPVDTRGDGEEQICLVDENTIQNEIDLAKSLFEKMKVSATPPEVAIKALDSVKAQMPTATEEQLGAIYQSMVRPVSIIQGGAGVGKSYTMGGIIKGFQAIDKAEGRYPRNVVLAAPTGVVADKLSDDLSKDDEYIADAKTLHDLIGWENIGSDTLKPGDIDGDVFIIDESGMIDLSVMKSLFDGIKKEATVVLVGDHEQLASIGAGQPFLDLYESEKLPISRLTITRRQKKGSQIIDVYEGIKKTAKEIEDGAEPDSATIHDLSQYHGSENEVLALPVNNVDDCLSALKLAYEYATKQLGYDRDEVQVITPVRETRIGTNSLNEYMRGIANTVKSKQFAAGKSFSVNDRVMITKNDKRKGLANGTKGVIVSEYKNNRGQQVFNIKFGKREMRFLDYEMRNVEMSYAVTVHKTQGDEYPCVIMPVSSEAKGMLQNRVMSVGASRAKEKLIFLYENEAWSKALKNSKTHRKNTLLKAEVEKLSKEKPKVKFKNDNVVKMKVG